MSPEETQFYQLDYEFNRADNSSRIRIFTHRNSILSIALSVNCPIEYMGSYGFAVDVTF